MLYFVLKHMPFVTGDVSDGNHNIMLGYCIIVVVSVKFANMVNFGLMRQAAVR